MHHRLRIALTLLAATAAFAATPGCGGGDSGTALEGIYEADTWTLNDTGCDAEGADVLSTQTDTTFYIKQENFLGAKFLNLNFCQDVADCNTLAADDTTINLGPYGFDQGSDADGWRSEYFSGFATNNVCDGMYVEASLSGDDTAVRVEIRSTPSSGFAPDADGFCDDAAGKQAAEGQTCAQLEVFTASRVADLP